MKTKYVFLDIDGTLVGYDSKIPESALLALTKAQKNGHKVIIASGRSASMIYPSLLEAIDFDGIIASGGACIMRDGNIIFRSIIQGDDLDSIISYFKKENIYFIVQATDAIYGEQSFLDVVIPSMINDGLSEELVKKTFMGVKIVDDVRSVKGIEKLSFYLSPNSPDKISEDNGGRYYVVDFSVGSVKEGALYFGEMTLAGVNKATAIERYMAYVGASVEDTIAIGDSGNDLEMINFAHIGVAMGNATEPIKAAADFTTTAVDDDGIYNAFIKLGLI